VCCFKRAAVRAFSQRPIRPGSRDWRWGLINRLTTKIRLACRAPGYVSWSSDYEMSHIADPLNSTGFFPSTTGQFAERVL
jgi:hypothetical protein